MAVFDTKARHNISLVTSSLLLRIADSDAPFCFTKWRVRKRNRIMSITDEEIELKKRGFTLGTCLGEGSYAKVKSAYNEKTQKRVAVKIIDRRKTPKDFREKFLPRELKVHATIEHPNVIKLFEIFEFHNKVSHLKAQTIANAQPLTSNDVGHFDRSAFRAVVHFVTNLQFSSVKNIATDLNSLSLKYWEIVKEKWLKLW